MSQNVFRTLDGVEYKKEEIADLDAVKSLASLRAEDYGKVFSRERIDYLGSTIMTTLDYLDFETILGEHDYNLKENKGKERIKMERRKEEVFVDFPLHMEDASKTKKAIYDAGRSFFTKWFKTTPVKDLLDFEEISKLNMYNNEKLKEQRTNMKFSRENDRLVFSLTCEPKEGDKKCCSENSKRTVYFDIKGKVKKIEMEKNRFGVGTPYGSLFTDYMEIESRIFESLIFGSEELRSVPPYIALNGKEIGIAGLADFAESEMVKNKLERIKGTFGKSSIKNGFIQIEMKIDEPLTLIRKCIDVDGLKKGLPSLAKELGI